MDGVRCARCIGHIENALNTSDSVDQARVNFSTGRLALSWSGDRAYGDQLLGKVENLGYPISALAKTASDSDKKPHRPLLKALAVAGFAMGNMMLISITLWVTGSSDMGAATRDLFHWVQALIALPTVLYAGRPFFSSAYGALRCGRTNMDVPISLALILAPALSIMETITHGDYVYFDSAVMLLFFLLIGRYLEAEARGRARSAASDLMQHFTGTAHRVEGNQLVATPIRDLRAGMVVRVAAGGRIPLDGHILKGEADIDTSLITGESVPAFGSIGDVVYGGTTVGTGSVDIEIDGASEKSLLSEIIRLMEVAEQGHGHYVRLADRAAALYTPLVHSLALITFLIWTLGLGAAWQPALITALTVLIITCPCALGLAVPVVQVLTSTWLFKQGILLKSGDALERLAAIKQVVYDKTGTLTMGQPRLIRHSGTAGDLALAAALAQHSHHPLCQALGVATNPLMVDFSDIVEHPGKGIEARLKRRTVRLGSADFIGAKPDPKTRSSQVWFQVEGRSAICFCFEDALRPDANIVVGALSSLSGGQSLLSGDRSNVVARTAQATGLDTYFAEQSPKDKVAQLEKQQANLGPALMVGDGLNDAAALSTAYVSMSPSSALDISQQASDIVFQGKSLRPVLQVYEAAKVSTRLVKQNFGLAVAYNLVAIPLAMMGHVTPMLAAIAMSGSSILVIGNAFRLGGIMRRKGC